ncbi:MAG: thioredoxin family protein [Candidatus Geothermarchaeales archaeon]
MGIIPEKEFEHIREHFSENLRDDVRLVVFTQELECEFCGELKRLAEGVASASDKIKVEVYDFVRDAERAREFGVERIPAVAVIGKRDYGIRFYGLPSGYEFTSLIEGIVDASKGATQLSNPVKEKLQRVDAPIHIQVFVTPTCPYCTRMVRLAHQFALESDFIRADMVEATEFPQLAYEYGVMAVPKTIINEGVEVVGAMPEEQFIERVLSALKPATT